MNWTDLQITVATKHLETAAAVAQMTVPYGIQIEDYSDMLELVPQIAHIDLIDEELLSRSKEEGIIHIYIRSEENPGEAAAFITGRLEAVGVPHAISIGSLEEDDWANSWKDYYHPTPIGKGLVVCPTWEKYTAKAGEKVILLDPGMAFGTGTHHTTRLCAELLEEFFIPGSRLLDMGTGSGILSIAALKLGAREAVGVDIDPVAVRTAAENALLNGYGPDKFVPLTGDLTRTAAPQGGDALGTFDFITANIVADVIIAMAPAFPALLAPGGTLVASGIIDTRKDEVIGALAAQGLGADIVREREGWCALVCRRAG